MYNEMGLLSVLFLIIGIIVDIVIAFFFSTVMNNIKEDKGYSNEFHFFALCFWLGFLGWFITATIVIALPDFRLQEEIRRLSNKDGTRDENIEEKPKQDDENVSQESTVSSLGNMFSPYSKIEN